MSVVIPTYRHAGFVLDTLASVQAQTLSDLEVIVVNDGSPDDTAQVLAPLREAGVIRYLEQPNAGQGAARNRGIAQATGRFIALLDDDDLWPPDKLARQVAALEANPRAVMVFGDYELLQPQGAQRVLLDPGPAGVMSMLLPINRIRSPGQTLIRAEALRQIGGFDPAIWGCDDWDLYLRLSRVGVMVYEPGLSLRYRVHASNASRQLDRMAQNSRLVLRRHFRGRPVGYLRTLGVLRYGEGLQDWRRAGEMMAAGEHRAARPLVRRAVWRRPGLLTWKSARRDFLFALLPWWIARRRPSLRRSRGGDACTS